MDQADLDFGIYRIMNQKRDEITSFLEKDLLPQVKVILSQFGDEGKKEVENELAKATKQAQELGYDPETSTRVKELKQKLSGSTDIAALENEVYSHLYNFFRRYYDEGDFFSLRRYKEGVYAIPYEGEEVKLHWANADQYYIKNSEYLRNFTFKLPSGKRVHFKTVEANTEIDDRKAQEGKERRFLLHSENPATEENGELFINFKYLPDEEKRKQDVLNRITIETILGSKKYPDWIKELSILVPTEKNPQRTLLEKQLTSYTARNTFDYFIHKDLGGFLQRELNFYIKNEVMHLDDIENESAPRVESYLNKIKAIRKIASKIIQFLEQLENFQKKLWLKKKFVVETNYCITLDRIPEKFYPHILENKAQIEEWKRLFAIDEFNPVLVNGNRNTDESFPKYCPYLVLDTAHFNEEFKEKLLSGIEDLNGSINGLLIQSENFQALELLDKNFKEHIKCVYIDPPYNTGSDEFLYKDNYQHSSWLSMMAHRLILARRWIKGDGVIFISIDDNEHPRLNQILRDILGQDNFIATLPTVMNLKGNQDEFGFAGTHEYTEVFSYNKSKASIGQFDLDEEDIEEWEEDEYGLFKKGANLKSTGQNAPREKRPNLYFPLYVSEHSEIFLERRNEHDVEIYPLTDGREMSWRWSKKKIKNELHNILILRENDEIAVYKKQRPSIGDLPSKKPKSLFYKPEYSSGNGTTQIKHLFGRKAYKNPKPIDLIEDIVLIAAQTNSYILDFFAGSGTTGHAVINLNREDGGNRKYILVEMAGYFDTVILPRIKKVVYSKDWRDGKPVSREGSSHMFKYIRLESYEDTLNNLELKRINEQQELIEENPHLKEEYLLSYMLDVEAKGSASLLNIKDFENPFDYKLKITRGDETRLATIDLVETFNYLIGLWVKHIDMIRGVEVVQGTNPEGDRVLILWRNVKEMDNDKLDDWFRRQGYNSKDTEFDLIYVNGDNNLENMRREDQTWKVRLIEEEFHRLMFDVKDV